MMDVQLKVFWLHLPNIIHVAMHLQNQSSIIFMPNQTSIICYKLKIYIIDQSDANQL